LPAETAAVAVLRETLARIHADAAACLAADDPERPHQLRVGFVACARRFGCSGRRSGGRRPRR